jgi:predicted ATPase
MALHAGEAVPREGDYLAAPLNRLARLLAAGHGSQILLTEVVERLVTGALPTGVSLRPLGSHRLRDLFEPEEVFQVVAPGLPNQFPPLYSLPRHPSNLTIPPTALIGREGEIAEVLQLFQPAGARLVTLTGAGGVGKTRLAQEIATEAPDRFPDGAFFVDLSPLTDPTLVIPTIAVALGVREMVGQTLFQTLSGFLADKRLLLLLDNCERVLESASDIAALLAACPHLAILATSREPLHIRAERDIAVAPLPIPEPGRLPAVPELAGVAAVALFVERAQAANASFALTAENAAAVAGICRRLDGLPLAIELAAARVKVLPPTALLARLEQRLPLLTGGGRDLPARQRTMRDALAWSYDLLATEEQIVFRRLAVFAGGCTLEAAEAVAGQDGTIDVFASIAALVESSLLRQEEDGAGAPRFRMLETVREYGLEQLERNGEGEETRNRLAAWSLILSQQIAPDDYFGNMSSWSVARVGEELPNLRAAITWLLARGEATRALRLLVAAEDYWLQRHITNTELHRWLEMALAAAPDAPGGDRAIAHWLLSIGYGLSGKDEMALLHAQQLLATANELGDPQSLGFAHLAMAIAWENQGDLARAAAALAETRALWHGANDWYVQAELGDILILQGDLEAGVPLVEDALARLRGLTDPPWFVVLTINVGGYAALRQQDLPRAAGLFAEALDRGRDRQHMLSLLSAMVGLAGVAVTRGQAERAARLLGAIEAAHEAVGIKRGDNWLYAERITAETRAALEPAAFERARSTGAALSLEEAVAEAATLANEVTTSADG